MTTADKRYPARTDTDPMPFGKYKGEPMQDVPASYLAWLWRDGLRDYSRSRPDGIPAFVRDKTLVANYIWNSKSAIEQELGETL